MPLPISPETCVQCKGRLWCGLNTCPILERFEGQKQMVQAIKGTSFAGSAPPGLFVSWAGYPKVGVAPLAPVQHLPDAGKMDEPDRWFGLATEEIIGMRGRLVSSSASYAVKQARKPDRTLSTIQELTLSPAPVNVEVDLHRRPSSALSFSSVAAPVGLRAPLKRLLLGENPRVPKKVDYLVEDTEVRAATAVEELYKKQRSVAQLQKLLSSGNLGVERDRKLVPTRWAITAVDTMVSEQLLERVRNQQQLGEVLLFESNYLDNHFFVLLVPGAWQFELLECWQPGGSWALFAKEPVVKGDYEPYEGRSRYVEETAGAYYAARLGVAEYLAGESRQAVAVVFREIGSGYGLPLGVWQIRENVRNALAQKPRRFSELNNALSFASKYLKTPMQVYKKKSRALDNLLHQKRLAEWG